MTYEWKTRIYFFLVVLVILISGVTGCEFDAPSSYNTCLRPNPLTGKWSHQLCPVFESPAKDTN